MPIATVEIKQLTDSDKQRFWSKVDQREQGECWLWRGERNRYGYGISYPGSRRHRAHRVAYVLSRGRIPDNLLVLHRCDNPPCCNPAHLFLGTCADNIRDAIQKGRHPGIPNECKARGVKQHLAKLTDSTVTQMRDLYRLGTVSLRNLARAFGVSKTTTLAVVQRKTWRHVP